jgi:hypothetical protein
MHLRWLSFVVLFFVVLGACSGDAITNCDNEPDVTGSWALTLTPAPGDLGMGTSITDTVEVTAELEQAGKTDIFAIGHYVYGTVTASNADYFGTLTIPRLLQNNGGKTGAVLGCELRVNVPIATNVTDDNLDQGPLRLSLAGSVIGKGVLAGGDISTLIQVADPTQTPRAFSWTGHRR